MSKGDSLGDRMKKYEGVHRHYLQPRTPTIIRVDGKAFHTFTKRFEFPFSPLFHELMARTASGMMLELQNARVAYTQSDEISFLLNDWDEFGTQQWFGGVLQKMASVAAATASAHFIYNFYDFGQLGLTPSNLPKFDARVFQLPKEEVNNYFVWRQQDATRNSVQMLGRAYFSHKQMHKKNVSNIQDMLMAEHGINWNDLDTWKKRGTCVESLPHNAAYVNKDIPIFTADTNYIEKFLQKRETT